MLIIIELKIYTLVLKITSSFFFEFSFLLDNSLLHYIFLLNVMWVYQWGTKREHKHILRT